jgi:hypothetical protein
MQEIVSEQQRESPFAAAVSDDGNGNGNGHRLPG